MDHSDHNKIVSFIWSIADDCLRDVYVREKYRDVILPMFVLRRLDCLLELTKEAVEETESDLRDFKNIPLKEDIHEYFLREVRPHVEEAWINLDQTKIGYEISFNKYFFQHKPLRSLEEVTADILKLEEETEGLLKKLVSFTGGNHGQG
jgi:type I restriction enzyme M protein